MITSAYNASNIFQPIQSTSNFEQLVSSLLAIKKQFKKLVQNFNDIVVAIGMVILVLLLFVLTLPLLPITYIAVIGIFKVLAKKISHAKELLNKDISKLEFKDVKNLELHLVVLRNLSEYLLNNTSKNIFSKFILSSIISIKENTLEMLNLCTSQFKFKEEDMDLSPEELIEYKKAFSAFSDIWDYQSTETENENTFILKKNINRKLA
jgi:hypothetical protein